MDRITPLKAKEKIYRYCAYQERSHQEVRNKLYAMGLWTDEVDELIAHLITEGYLNEDRFARAYAGGKFRMKSWGRNKIKHALEAKGVSANCIRSGLKEIDEQDYQQRLREVLQKRMEQSPETNSFIKRDKVARYAIQRGFEPELVWSEVKSMLPE